MPSCSFWWYSIVSVLVINGTQQYKWQGHGLYCSAMVWFGLTEIRFHVISTSIKWWKFLSDVRTGIKITYEYEQLIAPKNGDYQETGHDQHIDTRTHKIYLLILIVLPNTRAHALLTQNTYGFSEYGVFCLDFDELHPYWSHACPVSVNMYVFSTA